MTFEQNNQEKTYENKLHDLIHTLRTPLASIKVGADILKEILPILVEHYKGTTSIGHANKVDARKLDKLDMLINNISLDVDRMTQHINNIENRENERVK